MCDACCDQSMQRLGPVQHPSLQRGLHAALRRKMGVDDEVELLVCECCSTCWAFLNHKWFWIDEAGDLQ